MARFLYVNNNTRPNSVTAYSVDQNGSLTELPGSPFLTGGDGGDIGFEVLSATAVAAFGKLYVSNSTTQDVSGFNINSDGSLTPLPGSPYNTGTDVAAGVAVEPMRKILYVSSTCSLTAAFKIQADGTLVLLPGSPFGPFLGTGFMSVITKDGENLFSDCRTEIVGSLAIQPDGSLVENPGSPFASGTFNNHGLALSNDDTLLFVCGAADPNVSVFSVSPTGTLTLVPGSPFPSLVNDPDLCVVHPTLNLLFVADAISAGINFAAFTFDSSGTLTPAGPPISDGGAGPRVMVTNPEGTLLFITNSISQDVSVLGVGGIPIPGSPFPGLKGQASGIALVDVVPQPGRSLFPNKQRLAHFAMSRNNLTLIDII
jgi:6-phosphogluconolactonase (cycloisomerase 2 family)